MKTIEWKNGDVDFVFNGMQKASYTGNKFVTCKPLETHELAQITTYFQNKWNGVN